jgi:NAD(P)-dependent dehydrogenase (short-subunit alcohol dehydrogenase family)
MKIEGSVALVTGANRGLGRAFARELIYPEIQSFWDLLTAPQSS